MISPFRMNLKPEWLPALSNLATLAPGALCAWQGLDTPPLPEDARQALLEEELLDPAGAPTPGLISVINLLSAPSASLQLQLNNSFKSFDYRVFFSGQEGESASLLQNGNGLVLTAPARPNDLLSSLRQHTGDSPLQPVSFSADLPLTEALALAALLDRYRDFMNSLHCGRFQNDHSGPQPGGSGRSGGRRNPRPAVVDGGHSQCGWPILHPG